MGLTSTGNFTQLDLSNFTGYVSGANPGFSAFELGALPLGPGGSLTLGASTGCWLDTVELVASNSTAVISPAPVQASLAPQLSPTTLSITSSKSTWGILQVGQTYSQGWGLLGSLSTAPHILVNIGLNGWLVNLAKGQQVTAKYLPNAAVGAALEIQGILVPIIVAAGWAAFYRRKELSE